MLSEAEMKNVFAKVGIRSEDAENIFKAADSNKVAISTWPFGTCIKQFQMYKWIRDHCRMEPFKCMSSSLGLRLRSPW